MYTDKYAPWEHYPKTLRQAEVQNPMRFVNEFFSGGRVEDHQAELKEWRDCVISDRYFNDERHGPGSLLFIAELNLKLLEAAFLLLLIYEENKWSIKKLDEEQIKREKENWDYFPDNLSENELLNPYEAVKAIFENISPQQYRDYLQEWLHSALYTRAIDEAVTAGEVIVVYENLLKLYSATWIVHQRNHN